jgi:small-conductance mechanosensitive channel
MTWLRNFLHSPLLPKVVHGLIAVLLLYIVYRIVRRGSSRIAEKKLKPTTAKIIENVVRYTFMVLGVMYILSIFGISLNALLGAAGVAGITIGFAAQTSVSNIISGFFLLGEKVISIGDYITVGDTSGTVNAIDMLSVKLKTADGQLVRISNESIIKSDMINYSYYPTRRIALKALVSFSTDLQTAIEVLQSVPSHIPLILSDPAPLCLFDAFESSGVSINLFVWVNRTDMAAVKNALIVAVKNAFDEHGIKIPLPQVDVHTTPY